MSAYTGSYRIALSQRVIGAVRLRQLRVEKDGCDLTTAKAIEKIVPEGCLPRYSESKRSESSYGANSTGFRFYDYATDPTKLYPTTEVEGVLSNYDPSGFYVFVPVFWKADFVVEIERLRVSPPASLPLGPTHAAHPTARGMDRSADPGC